MDKIKQFQIQCLVKASKRLHKRILSPYVKDVSRVLERAVKSAYMDLEKGGRRGNAEALAKIETLCGTEYRQALESELDYSINDDR